MANIREIAAGGFSSKGRHVPTTSWFSKPGILAPKMKDAKGSSLTNILNAWFKGDVRSQLTQYLDFDQVQEFFREVESGLAQTVSRIAQTSIFEGVTNADHLKQLRLGFPARVLRVSTDIRSVVSDFKLSPVEVQTYSSAWSTAQGRVLQYICHMLFYKGMTKNQRIRLTSDLNQHFAGMAEKGTLQHYRFMKERLCSSEYCLIQSLWPRLFEKDLNDVRQHSGGRVLETVFQKLHAQTGRLLDYAFGSGFAAAGRKRLHEFWMKEASASATVENSSDRATAENAAAEASSGVTTRSKRKAASAKGKTAESDSAPRKRSKPVDSHPIGGGGGGGSEGDSSDVESDAAAEDPMLQPEVVAAVFAAARRIILGLSIKFDPADGGNQVVGVPFAISQQMVFKLAEHDILLERASGEVNFDTAQLESQAAKQVADRLVNEIKASASMQHHQFLCYSRGAAARVKGKSQQKRKSADSGEGAVQPDEAGVAAVGADKPRFSKGHRKKKSAGNGKPASQQQRKAVPLASQSKGGSKASNGGKKRRDKPRCYLCGSLSHLKPACTKKDTSRCGICNRGYHLLDGQPLHFTDAPCVVAPPKEAPPQ